MTETDSATRSIEDIYPLTPMQEGMLFHSLLDPESGVYVDQLVAQLNGELDISSFRRAWQEVVNRHTILRTSFVWEDVDRPLQIVQRQVELPLIYDDWEGLTQEESQSRFTKLIEEDLHKPFDFNDPPLMRIILIRFNPITYQMIWSSHHLLIDGWSLPLVFREVITHYEGFRIGKKTYFERPKPYRDYIAWLQKQDLEASLNYWRNYLEGFTSPTPLIIDMITEFQSPTGHPLIKYQLSLDSSNSLRKFSLENGITLNTLIQSAWAVILNRYSGEDDIVFGATVSGRPPDLTGAEKIIGMFINTLPVRVKFSNQSLIEWMKNLQTEGIKSRQFEFTPLVDIQKVTQMPAGKSLFDSIFVFENYPVDETVSAQKGSVTISNLQHSSSTNYPITVIAAPSNQIEVHISYDSGKVSRDLANEMLNHLGAVLEMMPLYGESYPTLMPISKDKSIAMLLDEWKLAQVENPRSTIHQMIEIQANKSPEAVAIIAGEKTITYRELNKKSNQLAHFLIQQGVFPETRVGICIDRSPELLIGILGILKSGGMFVPLDPAMPKERLEYILEDSESKILLTQADYASLFSSTPCRKIFIDSEWQKIKQSPDGVVNSYIEPHNGAYIIYTSGTTGFPKGVFVEHHSLVNHATYLGTLFEIDEGSRILGIISISFDAAGEEIYPTLVKGGTLVLAPKDIDLTGKSILGFCDDNQINILHLPAPVWNQIVTDVGSGATKVPNSIRMLALGGEKPSKKNLEIWTRFLDHPCKFVNLYGPTEATITSTSFAVDCTDENLRLYESFPIGKPIQNSLVLILDQKLNILPAGIPGEIFIAGEGLARGYHNNLHLTEEKFPSISGTRFYRTGDRGYWLSDGNLYFIGRSDLQVKWRGYRIELEEIENTIRTYQKVRDVAVLLREDEIGVKRLVAYIVAKNAEKIQTEELRKSLKRLPEYMIPTNFVQLDVMPLTMGGKIDRRALPIPESDRLEEQLNLSPNNAVEEILIGLVEDILGIDQVRMSDNFFELGGHSLLATQLISKLRGIYSVDLPLRLLFDEPRMSDIARNLRNYLVGPSPTDEVAIVPAARDGDIPLSYSQQRLWFLDQLEPGNLFYNIATAVKFEGFLNILLLEQALTQIVKRHEILRTTFEDNNGKPRQVIHPNYSAHINQIDFRGKEQPNNDDIFRLMQEKILTPIDLTQLPLFHVHVFSLSQDMSIVLLVIHHIIADGWSMNLLVKELSSLYAGYILGQEMILKDLPIQYADYSIWQKNWLKDDRIRSLIDYWKSHFEGAAQLLELPTDRPRPSVKTSNGASEILLIPSSITQKIMSICKQEGVTHFMFFLALFKVLLFRFSSQEDISVGSAIANRNRREIEELIGFFVNTLVFRSVLSGKDSFRDFLTQVRDVTLNAYAHQDLPFEILVDSISPARNLSYSPLFQVGLDFQHADLKNVEFPNLKVSPFPIESSVSGFDLLLSITNTSEGFLGSFEFNKDLFDRSTIKRHIKSLLVLLEGVLDDVDKEIRIMPILEKEDFRRIIVDWNRTERNLFQETCIHHRFERWVDKCPDQPALILDEQHLSYLELNRKSNQLARVLQKKGVNQETIVGIFAPRSFELFIGILAILKAGGGYLPLDPNYPVERLKFMIRDVIEAKPGQGFLILCQDQMAQVLVDEGIEPISITEVLNQHSREDDHNLGVLTKSEDLAYVIYTSGSTGRPKGTLLTHRGLCNLSEAQRMAFNISERSRILQFSPISFDASVWETFMALGNGATLILSHQDVLSSAYDFIDMMKTQAVTVATLPPSYIAALPQVDLPALQTIIAAGEACPKEIVDRWAPGREFFNAYGPTETTVCATMASCKAGDDHAPRIGKPLPNFKIFVVDRYLQPVPIGVPGELLVSGIGLARGYLNRPQLSAEKFLPNPYFPGSRLYRTGDLVKLHEDGNLEFLGRIDQQVKIRGFRIEIGEIEAALRRNPYVNDAVVLVRTINNGDKQLVGYYTQADSRDQLVEPKMLRDQLRQELPEFMVPSFLIPVEKFPVTPSGKIDREKLPDPQTSSYELAENIVSPRNETEVLLVNICSSLLGIERMGIYNNFFDMGGHSLLATQFISRIREQFQIEIPLRSLFEHPTIAELAIEIDRLRSSSETSSTTPSLKAISREARKMKRSDL